MDRCEACRFVYDEVAVDDAVARIRTLPGRYGAELRAADAVGLARTRPASQIWSALEYTCHVRDVLDVQHDRLHLALEQDRPTFSPMGRDERVTRDRYNEQDVEVVITDLEVGATRFADACAGLEVTGWQRTGVYNWPEPAERTMAWLVRHTLHEAVHHLADVKAVVARVRDAQPSERPSG